MGDARGKLLDGLQRASALSSAPEHRRAELESQAFEALRTGLVAARKEEELLDRVEEEQMLDALELIAKRGSEKRMLRGRAVECLKSALGRPSWLRAAHSRPALLTALRELVAESSPELSAALEAAPPVPEEDAPEEPVTRKVSYAYDRKPDVEGMLTAGRDVMRQFHWQFPADPLGGKLDAATAGFQSFFDGMTRLTTTMGKASLETGVSELLQSFEPEWPGILQFCVSMYSSGKRNVYRSRVKFVVVKLRELAPGFCDVIAGLDGGLPWPCTPCASMGSGAVASSLLSAAGDADAPAASSTPASAPPPPPPPRFGIVWIDFKAQAYASSFLRDEASVDLMGFHDDESAPDYAPRERWMEYILERAEDPCRRVAAVIINRKHLQSVKDIRAFCAESGLLPPKFVVCTRARPEEIADWGVDAGSVTKDWVRAAQLALQEVKSLSR